MRLFCLHCVAGLPRGNGGIVFAVFLTITIPQLTSLTAPFAQDSLPLQWDRSTVKAHTESPSKWVVFRLQKYAPQKVGNFWGAYQIAMGHI